MKSSQEWENLLNNLGNKPEYTSKYQSSIDGLLDKITNREQFSYDFNADPLYQQYKDNFVKLGNEASMNAAANASALSGGYGNSYAATAASQANQQYLAQLNNVIPELANAALNKYQMETQDLYNQYAAVGNAEDRLYGQYRDTVNDYYTNRDYYTQGYQDARDYEHMLDREVIDDDRWNKQWNYQQYRDQVADSQWREQFDTSKNQWDKTYNYNVSRDQVADSQWDKQFQYQQERDKISDAQWEKNYLLNSLKAKASGGSGTSKSSTGKTSAIPVAQQKENDKYATDNDSFIRYKAETKYYPSNDEKRSYIEYLATNKKISFNQADQLLRELGLY